MKTETAKSGKKPANGTGQGKQYTVDYEIQEASEGVEMSRKELQRFLKANGGGRLRKDKGEFEDDYASDDLAFFRKVTMIWKPSETGP